MRWEGRGSETANERGNAKGSGTKSRKDLNRSRRRIEEGNEK
jgi:hypothetical protein